MTKKFSAHQMAKGNVVLHRLILQLLLFGSIGQCREYYGFEVSAANEVHGSVHKRVARGFENLFNGRFFPRQGLGSFGRSASNAFGFNGQSKSIEPRSLEFYRNKSGSANKKLKGYKELKGKLIGLYFSRYTCAPCHVFLRNSLKPFYERTKNINSKELKNKFEVVYVPTGEASIQDMNKYLQEQPQWLYLPMGGDADQLSRNHQIYSVPSLVIVNLRGEIIDREGRGRIGGPAETVIAGWKQKADELEQAHERSRKESSASKSSASKGQGQKRKRT